MVRKKGCLCKENVTMNYATQIDVDAMRSELASLSGLVTHRRSELSSKRQMLLDWKRVATEGYRLNKNDIEREMEAVVTKMRAAVNALTKDTSVKFYVM